MRILFEGGHYYTPGRPGHPGPPGMLLVISLPQSQSSPSVDCKQFSPSLGRPAPGRAVAVLLVVLVLLVISLPLSSSHPSKQSSPSTSLQAVLSLHQSSSSPLGVQHLLVV